MVSVAYFFLGSYGYKYMKMAYLLKKYICVHHIQCGSVEDTLLITGPGRGFSGLLSVDKLMHSI